MAHFTPRFYHRYHQPLCADPAITGPGAFAYRRMMAACQVVEGLFMVMGSPIGLFLNLRSQVWPGQHSRRLRGVSTQAKLLTIRDKIWQRHCTTYRYGQPHIINRSTGCMAGHACEWRLRCALLPLHQRIPSVGPHRLRPRCHLPRKRYAHITQLQPKSVMRADQQP